MTRIRNPTLAAAATSARAGRAPPPRGTTSVSYTHLDVYKRQLLDSEVASLRAGERLTDSLLRAMSDGVGLDGLLAEIASVVGAPVRLTDTAGGMVARCV